jgi:tetratricopeptide (TPR) repeat protein
LGALDAIEFVPLEQRSQLLLPILADPVRSVRIEAARLLAGTPPLTLTALQRERLRSVSDEYLDAQRYNADRPESWINIGLFETARQNLIEAESAYRTAINLDPTQSAGYVNLADLYRGLQRDEDGFALLNDAVTRLPEDAALNHALGLALIRRSQADQALGYLKVGAEQAPENARYTYVYAVAQNSAGESDAAINTLKEGLDMHPNNADLLFASATMLRDAGETSAALVFAKRLQVILPGDQTVGSLVESLESGNQQ